MDLKPLWRRNLKLDGVDPVPEAQAPYCRLIGPPNKAMDVESLQSSGRRRGSFLDVCLVASVVFLFVAVAAVAVCGAMFVTKLQTNLESPPPNASRLTGDAHTNSGYKMQNFVYLTPDSSSLQTSTMKWREVKYGAGGSVGSNFVFEPIQDSLRPRQEGHYFMYINLNLTCVHICKSGVLRVQVGDKLTCELELPEVADSVTVTKKCWTVSRLEEQGLITQMTTPNAGMENWRLDLNNSGFGMFLVD